MPIFDSLERLKNSRMRKTQLTNRELQDEVAANCRLSRLPADIKIHILTLSNISSIRTLLQYLPLAASSFHRLFDERKRAILAAIVKDTLSLEWSIISGNETYVPLAPLKLEYFNQIALVVCALFHKKRFEEMKRGIDDNGWLRNRSERPKTMQDLRVKIYKAAKSNALDLLKLLEEVQGEVKAKEEIMLQKWKEAFGNKRNESWIVSWVKGNLYRALLIEWKLQLPETAMPTDAIRASDTNGRIQQTDSASQAVRSRLTDEEWMIMMDLMEARASCESRKIEIVRPEKLSTAGEEIWGIFLDQLNETQSTLICGLGKGISTLPSFSDISGDERAYLEEKFLLTQ
ncbi:hypothetical protein HCEG_00774 [Histoplasma capsulatum var. duboisii H88]|uniref:Uncharacterized protein n=1 Tax=Ajellomyces capsulatus (strain H88) TaxID=544711 RepID=F0U621_AJEC8|nr:hypothetical protein HCEG_00774 [Histoplasma capsulatum var. duboisii H88]QSS52163.1 hypothetical protein I7I53_07696 [Histoplasma capsulatum var. duboisii H88]